jgi:hypothetical protein
MCCWDLANEGLGGCCGVGRPLEEEAPVGENGKEEHHLLRIFKYLIDNKLLYNFKKYIFN